MLADASKRYAVALNSRALLTHNICSHHRGDQNTKLTHLNTSASKVINNFREVPFESRPSRAADNYHENTYNQTFHKNNLINNYMRKMKTLRFFSKERCE